MLWPRLLGAVLAVPAFVLPFGIRLDGPASSMSGGAVAADVAPVTTRIVVAPGFVEPISEVVSLSAAAMGTLTSLKIEEGDKVATGEVIGEIDNADLRAELAVAESELTIRQNELARLDAGARDQERAEAEAELHEADAGLALARLQFDRQKVLVGKAVAQAALDQARSDLDTATARRDAMAEKFSLIEAPPRPEDVAIAQAQVDAATSHVAEIQALIAKTLVRSPIDGVLLRRYARPGEMMSLQPPTPIAQVGDITRLRVRAKIDEADVARVAIGQEAWITADAYPGRRFHGRVSRVGDIMGPKNFRTDEPGERMDTDVLEALVDLDPDVHMPIGLRVDVEFSNRASEASLEGAKDGNPDHASGLREVAAGPVFALVNEAPSAALSPSPCALAALSVRADRRALGNGAALSAALTQLALRATDLLAQTPNQDAVAAWFAEAREALSGRALANRFAVRTRTGLMAIAANDATPRITRIKGTICTAKKENGDPANS